MRKSWHIDRRRLLRGGRAEWSEAERVIDLSVAQMSMCLVTEAGALRCGGRGPSEERATGITNGRHLDARPALVRGYHRAPASSMVPLAVMVPVTP